MQYYIPVLVLGYNSLTSEITRNNESKQLQHGS